MPTLDSLPVEVLERILIIDYLDDEDAKPTNSIALGLTSRSLIDVARQSIVRSIEWPHSQPNEVALLLYVQQHHLNGHIRQIRIVQRRPGPDWTIVRRVLSIADNMQHLGVFGDRIGDSFYGEDTVYLENAQPALLSLSATCTLTSLDFNASAFDEYDLRKAVDLFARLLRQHAGTLRQISAYGMFDGDHDLVFGDLQPLRALRHLSVESCDDVVASAIISAAPRGDLSLRCNLLEPLDGQLAEKVTRLEWLGLVRWRPSFKSLTHVRELKCDGLDRPDDVAALPASLVKLEGSLSGAAIAALAQSLTDFGKLPAMRSISHQRRDGGYSPHKELQMLRDACASRSIALEVLAPGSLPVN